MNPSESYKIWQETWQESGRSADAGHLDDLMHRLGKYTDHMKKRNRIKLILLVLILAGMLANYGLRSRPGNQWPMIIGLGLIFLGTVVFEILYLRGQFQLAHLDFGSPALEFVRQIITALEKERRLFKVHFPILMLVLIVAVNVMTMGLWPTQTTGDLLLIHGLTSLALAVVGAIGWLYRRSLFRRKTGQLLVELRETEVSWSHKGVDHN